MASSSSEGNGREKVELPIPYSKFAPCTKEIIEIEWKISDFSELNPGVGFVIKSPFYPSKLDTELTWQLKFYPHGNREKNKEYCSLFLCKHGAQSVTAGFDFIIMDKSINEQKIFWKNNSQVYKPGANSWGFANFIKQTELKDKGILNDDTLTIICIIYINNVDRVEFNIDAPGSNKQNIKVKRTHDGKLKKISATPNQLDTEQFFGNDTFSDIQLITKEEIFNAHRCIICSASPVFMHILKNSKTRSSSITIDDISSNCVKEMLRYMYTGKLENLANIAHELVAAADKYDIRILKAECERYLCNYLSTDNLVDMLVLADSYRLTQLYVDISNLFVLNKNKIASTPEYIELEASNPRIISKFLTSLITENKM